MTPLLVHTNLQQACKMCFIFHRVSLFWNQIHVMSKPSAFGVLAMSFYYCQFGSFTISPKGLNAQQQSHPPFRLRSLYTE